MEGWALPEACRYLIFKYLVLQVKAKLSHCDIHRDIQDVMMNVTAEIIIRD